MMPNLSKERKEKLASYAQEAVQNYILIAIHELVKRFNENEKEKTTEEEMLYALHRFVASTPKIDQEFAIYHDIFVYDGDMSEEAISEMLIKSGVIFKDNEDGPCYLCGEVYCDCLGIDRDYDSSFEEKKEELLTQLAKNENDLIGLMAESAVRIYGILSFEELSEIIHHYYPQKELTKKDILPGLVFYLEKTEEVVYSIYEDLIIRSTLLADPDEIDTGDFLLINQIHYAQLGQNGKRYLPSLEEFIDGANPAYDYLPPQVDNLLEFLENNKRRLGITQKQLNRAFTVFIHLIRSGLDTKQFMPYFKESGCKFDSISFANEFMFYAIEVYNHSRMYELNGYSLVELDNDEEEETEDSELPTNVLSMRAIDTPVIKTKKMAIAPPRLLEKGSRNDLCPCGSGKKYKKCCL